MYTYVCPFMDVDLAVILRVNMSEVGGGGEVLEGKLDSFRMGGNSSCQSFFKLDIWVLYGCGKKLGSCKSKLLYENIQEEQNEFEIFFFEYEISKFCWFSVVQV